MNHRQIILVPGYSIWTKEEIIEDYKSWLDVDKSEEKDFSWHEYWIVDHDSGDTKGFDTMEEVIAFVDNYDLRYA